jgi:hypothetical protein
MFLLILAILGTFFFRNQDMDNFGTMFRASYTLFLALAFGEWDVLSVIEDGYINWGRLIYLMLVVFFLVWITTNVIITILLDKFVQVCVPVPSYVKHVHLSFSTCAELARKAPILCRVYLDNAKWTA